MDCPPSRTRCATRSRAACGDGSHKTNNEIRYPPPLHRFRKLLCVRPEHVVSNAKFWPRLASSSIRWSINRPADIPAPSMLNGDRPRAISSALTNSRTPKLEGKSIWAVDVLPAPLGPPMTMISFTSWVSCPHSYLIATGLIVACTAPWNLGWPRTKRNSVAPSAASAAVFMFSRM